MIRRSSKRRTTVVSVLASGIVGLVLLLVLPSLAMADPAVAEPAPATEAATPAAEPTPSDTSAPVDEAPPVDEGPIGEDTGAGEAPAPPPSEQTPVVEAPPTDGSATPAPEPETPVVPETPQAGSPLPESPDSPVLVGGETRTPALTSPTLESPDPVTVTPVLPSGPEEQVAAAVEATPPAKVTPPPAATPREPRAVLPDQLISLDPARDALAAMTAQESTLPSVPDEAVPGDPGLTQHLVAPVGSSQNGSSLLAVLAGYVLPGSGAPPASTIMMLVLLGLVLAAIYAPRPQGSERLYLSGLLGPRAGHGMAVRRPG